MNENLSGGWRVYVRSVVFVLAVLFAVGAAGHAAEPTLPWMLVLTPWFSLLTGLLVAAPSVAAGGWRFGVWVAAAYAFTFLAEAAGVATGAVFGEYAYGPTLGWAWRGVPLIIAFNWVMVVNGAVFLAGRALPPGLGGWRRPVIVLLAGAIAAAFDFIMEPVAIRLDYWHWAGDGSIPFRNYAAWFVLAAVAASVHPRQFRPSCDLGTTGRLAGTYVAMQAAFFLALRMIWHWQGT